MLALLRKFCSLPVSSLPAALPFENEETALFLSSAERLLISGP